MVSGGNCEDYLLDFYSVNCLVRWIIIDRIGKVGREVVTFVIISDSQADYWLIITINDTSTCDLSLIITISDTSKNNRGYIGSLSPKFSPSDTHFGDNGTLHCHQHFPVETDRVPRRIPECTVVKNRFYTTWNSTQRTTGRTGRPDSTTLLLFY